MDPGLSPFWPGQPAPVECFVGREHEIEHLYGLAKASTQGRLTIGFISGERGIGKSSLAAFVRRRCERESEMAACHVLLGGAQDLNGMVGKIFNQLLKESIDQPWYTKATEFFGDRIRSMGLFGISVELDLKEKDLSSIAANFSPSIRDFIKKTGKKGLLLVLDDINGLAGSAAVAHWLKSTVDELSMAEPETCLCLLVVGLEERRRNLIENQESLARVFNLFRIEAWSTEETREFYQKTFQSAGATIGDKGLDALVDFAGGLPVLAHELGNSVWRMAKNKNIDEQAVVSGIIDAAEIVGRKLLEPKIFNAIRSKKYRSILRKITSQRLISRFDRSEITRNLTKEEIKVLDNFLQRMRKLGALTQDPEVRGGYLFPKRLYSLYFSISSYQSQNDDDSQPLAEGRLET